MYIIILNSLCFVIKVLLEKTILSSKIPPSQTFQMFNSRVLSYAKILLIYEDTECSDITLRSSHIMYMYVCMAGLTPPIILIRYSVIPSIYLENLAI